MTKEDEESPPASFDLEGWHRAVARGELGLFRPEALLCAVQDLGPNADPAVLNPIVARLSEIIMKMARRHVGTNKPNRGEGIIVNVAGGIWKSLLDPKSKDGQTMRDRLGGIVRFRCLDAIALANKHSRIPLQPPVREVKRGENPDTVPTDRVKAREVSWLVQEAEAKERGAENDGFVGYYAVSATRPVDAAHFEGMRQLEEHIDVERVLARIPDDRKRLAFRFHMDGLPFQSKRTPSIARALGVSEKTAEVWIAEVSELLQQTDEFKELTNNKVGS
jgi:DNA-directed RNA polymerase specialized sigma24 family protein